MYTSYGKGNTEHEIELIRDYTKKKQFMIDCKFKAHLVLYSRSD